MKFLADESVDKYIVDVLREMNHSVYYVVESIPSANDLVVLEKATTLGALLITADKDFGDMVFRQGWSTKGILLLRLSSLDRTRKIEIVKYIIGHHHKELWGCFTVASENGVRIRSKLR